MVWGPHNTNCRVFGSQCRIISILYENLDHWCKVYPESQALRGYILCPSWGFCQVRCWINESLFLFSDVRYQAAMDPATPLENFYLTEGNFKLTNISNKITKPSIIIEMSNFLWKKMHFSQETSYRIRKLNWNIWNLFCFSGKNVENYLILTVCLPFLCGYLIYYSPPVFVPPNHQNNSSFSPKILRHHPVSQPVLRWCLL